MNLEEAALIAGLPPLPSRYSPYVNFDAARRRQSYVLNRMLAEGFISEADLQRAKDAPLNLRRRGSAGTLAPYFVEDVRRYLQEKYGSQRIYRGGLRVYTTLNIPMQQSAEKALDKALRDLDKRQGFRPSSSTSIEIAMDSLKTMSLMIGWNPLKKVRCSLES